MATYKKEQLNICFMANRFPVLSRATDHGFLWPIARGLSNKGHKVCVIASKSFLGKYEVFRDGVHTYYVQEQGSPFQYMKLEEAMIACFKSLHKENKFDLLHSIDRLGYRIGKYKHDYKVKIAYDIDATEMSQLFSILGMGQETVSSLLSTGTAVAYKFLTTYFGHDRKLLKTADGIFVTSPQQKIFLERYYLYPEYHTYQVPYGVELGDLSPHPLTDELRAQLNIPENSHILLTLTDMTEVQEISNLLEAFVKVAIKKPNAYMIIVGQGPKRKEIEYKALDLALGNRIKMPGAMRAEDISQCITLSQAYINLSSRSTGFEPAMIEAMAQKKIIIGSEVSPISNIVEDGQDGFLLRPADTESLSKLLIDIFSGVIPAEEIGRKAREKVLNIFDTRKMIQSVEDAYHKILEN